MTKFSTSKFRNVLSASTALALISAASLAFAQDVPIVQPGAPGEQARSLNASEAIEIVSTRYSKNDATFMRDMIPHHNQAVQMAELVDERTNHEEVIDIAGRITVSQADEIDFMESWLQEREEDVPQADAHDAMHTSHSMAGMATPEQMAELAKVEGVEFDQLFLTLMITHHEGAVTMVKELLKKRGSAYDPVLFDFVNDVTNDQKAEIKRMHELLLDLSSDPRAGLAAGFDDAEQAILNLELIASLPKPAGFFDPENPSGLPPIKPPKKTDKDGEDKATEEEEVETKKPEDESASDKKDADEKKKKKKTQWGKRAPLLSFSNTDMAFFGNKMIVGNYHGFNAYELQENGVPKLLSSVVCPGGQGDVSIVGDLLIMSVEQTRGRVDCGLQGIDEDVSEERFRGLRIFDISDLTNPIQVGQVQTCRGSHTHSVVSGPDKDGKIIVYNSGTSRVRKEEEMAGCIGNIAGDERTALFRIDVIEIPVDDPSKARIIDSPAVFADEETGQMAGLWRGGDHGDKTQRTNQTNQCHDITVFPEANIAAGACSGNGIIFDISDPRKPKRIDAVLDTGFAYWHSATFNNDGTKVIFTDEWGGGGRPRCRTYDPKEWGANAIYDITDGKLTFQSYYKLPAPQTENENCVAHNGSVIPVPGRDIFAQAWYQGGLSLMDFTDSANPVEIAYFDRGPIHEERMVTGGYWSTYWYNGKIYGTEIVRGLDVFALLPSEFLSENEIAAANIADQRDRFNPQQQFAITWPHEPVIARAYMDQLQRSEALSETLMAQLNTALDQADERLSEGKSDVVLAKQLENLAANVARNKKETANNDRQAALSTTLTGIAKRLR
ncbi:DUF305 domain-containing protein [Oceanicaulis sp. AH-315-P02]|nr:DUF305 domain-containing protein [Robiginitomaculum sp.]MBN4047720.1 DUF305 domain-containing protein [Oceanicaulis sp. AH-315-P02]